MNSIEMLIGERLFNMPAKDKGMLEPTKLEKSSFEIAQAKDGNRRKVKKHTVQGFIFKDKCIGLHNEPDKLVVSHTKTGRIIAKIKHGDNCSRAMVRYLPVIISYFDFDSEKIQSSKVKDAGPELMQFGKTLQALIKSWEGAALGAMVGSFYVDEMSAENMLLKAGMPKKLARALAELKPFTLKK